MSKLIDKLNQLTKATPQSIGFRVTPATSARPKILLIASLTQVSNASHLTDFADAVLITKPLSGTQKITQSPTDITWGLWMEDISKESTKPMIEAGCDFVPRLLESDPEALKIITTNCGARVEHLNEKRLKELYDELETYGVRHEDAFLRNVTYRQQDGRFCLIDFEFATILNEESSAPSASDAE